MIATPEWHYVEVTGGPYRGVVGAHLEGISLGVRNREGEPAVDVPVLVTIVSSGGSLEGGARTHRSTSDAAGIASFECTLPEQVGTFALDVSLPDQPGTATRLDVAVTAEAPAKIQIEGNNQAAIAGMRLPLPLGVLLADRFDNPVEGAVVEFIVKQGDGQFASGNVEVKVKTGTDGRASVPFVVSSDAGQNVVMASVEKTSHSARFIAFGTEI